MDDILSYRILVNLFIDKIKGSGCLYESEVRKDCLTTYNVPNYKYNNPVRPKGWCEICWLRFLLEESEISRTVAISELSKSKSKLDGVTLDNIFVSSKVNQS